MRKCTVIDALVCVNKIRHPVCALPTEFGYQNHIVKEIKMNAKSFAVLSAVVFFNATSYSQIFDQSTRSICEYGRGEALSEVNIKRGIVVHVSQVDIGASSSALALGGVLGGAGVTAFTNGQDWATRSALAALGVAAGAKVAEHAGQSEGVRFLIEDKQGTITALVAEADDCARAISKGDTVFVARGARTRLIRD